MSETAAESEALAILRRIEPTLGRIEDRLTTVSERVTKIEATLPYLATKDEVRQLGYDLTWRLLSLLGVILLAYLGAVWFVVTLTMRAHGVGS